jgi:hypothetical protein
LDRARVETLDLSSPLAEGPREVFLLNPRPWFSLQLETQGRQPGAGAVIVRRQQMELAAQAVPQSFTKGPGCLQADSATAALSGDPPLSLKGFPPMGRPDQLKGEGIVAIITLKTGRTGDEALDAGQEVSGDTSNLEDRTVLDALRV